MLIQISLNAQNCFWSDRSGNSESDNGRSIVTDQSGNVYITGFFASDTIIFGNTTLANKGSNSDLFVAKYNQTGQVIWARSFGSLLEDEGRGIACDANNNIYLTGYFRGDSISFGSTTLYNQILGYSEVFITKLDSNGTVLWAKSAGQNNQDDNTNDIITDATGIYITGRFHSSTISFDGITLQNHDSLAGDYDAFIAKYDFLGNAVWAKAINGLNYNSANSITVNTSGVFISGSFRSDTLFFDQLQIPNFSNGNESFYIAKYNLNGIPLWAKASQGNDYAVGNGLATNGSDIFLTGEYRSVIRIDTDTLRSSGSYDAFLISFNTNGNVNWAKSFGGSQDEVGYGIAVSSNGLLNLTGIFESDSVIFNSSNILYVSNSTNAPNSFFVQLNTIGDAQWSTCNGGVNYSRDVALDNLNNIYYTGYFNNSMSLSNQTISSSGLTDIFIAHPYQFSSIIDNVTNNNCYGASDGSISLSVSGGMNPIEYTWSNGDSSSYIDSLPAGTYVYQIADTFGCSITDSIIITQPQEDSLSICLVTVDSLSQHNVIVWDNSAFINIDSFYVYREIATNNYQIIGVVPFGSLSMFVDTVRSQYFPNTGDPNVGTYRYKIGAHNVCGGTTELSPYHNTIYIFNNAGTFSWSQLYTIENAANPVANYVLMRDDSSNGNWNAIGSVSGTQQTITDPQFSLFQNIASWRVQTQWSINCSIPLFNSSVSNLYRSSSVNVANLEALSSQLFPNPATQQVTINSNKNINSVQIYCSTGSLIKSFLLENNDKNLLIDISNYSKGIYLIRIESGNNFQSHRLIIK